MSFYALVNDGVIERVNIQLPITIGNTSIPAGATGLAEFGLYPISGSEPTYNHASQTLAGPVYHFNGAAVVREYTVESIPPEKLRAAAWERIKQERDRRKYLGVKVGAHWFHSDDPSRIQQLALAMMGAAIPAGLQWKTLTLTPPPVFVEMTPELAQSIFQATAASDAAIFAAAETHRLAMEASDSPESYDCNAGWPVLIEDEQGA